MVTFSENILAKNVKNSLFRSERLVVCIGLEDIIVVETLDAILVSNKNKTQDVKEIVKNWKFKVKVKLGYIKQYIGLGEIILRLRGF